jgi:hypothetical protein
VESKFNDEELSMGQAIVTSHFYDLIKQGKLGAVRNMQADSVDHQEE